MRFCSLRKGKIYIKNLKKKKKNRVPNKKSRQCRTITEQDIPELLVLPSEFWPNHSRRVEEAKASCTCLRFMAAKLLQPPIQASHVIAPKPRTTKMVKTQRFLPATHPMSKSRVFGDFQSGFTPIYTTKVTEQSSGIVGDETLAQIKTELFQAVQGMPAWLLPP